MGNGHKCRNSHSCLARKEMFHKLFSQKRNVSRLFSQKAISQALCRFISFRLTDHNIEIYFVKIQVLETFKCSIFSSISYLFQIPLLAETLETHEIRGQGENCAGQNVRFSCYVVRTWGGRRVRERCHEANPCHTNDVKIEIEIYPRLL